MDDVVGCDGLNANATALSMVLRMLHGDGFAQLIDYRQVITINSLVHGMTCDGRLAVAVSPQPGDPVDEMPFAQGIDVRLDITKESPEPDLQMIVATLHGLGVLRWAPEATRTAMIEDNILPPEVEMVASLPNGRLGLVEVPRLLLHDAEGVRSFDHELLRADGMLGSPRFLQGVDQIEAFHMVQAMGADAVHAIHRCVLTGKLTGRVRSHSAERIDCTHVWGQMYCADIDATGITWLQVLPEATTSVFVAFDRGVTTLEDLTGQLDRLLLVAVVHDGVV